MNRLYILSAVFTFLLLFSSCEDDKEIVNFDIDNAKAAQMISPSNGTTFQLNIADGAKDFETFTWSHAEFDAYVSRTYRLEMDKANNDFSNATVLTETAEAEFTMNVADLNAMVYDLNAGAPTDLELRVVTTGNNASTDTSLISDVVSITITPFAYTKPNLRSPADASAFVLDSNEVNFDEIQWAAVNYGNETLIPTYVLEFDKADSGFVTPVTIAKVTTNTYQPSTASFNAALLSRGLNADEAADINVRVTAYINDMSGVVYSDLVTYTVTPYQAEIGPQEPNKLYVPGDYQGWDPAGAPNIWDVEFDDTYFGHIYFPEGGTYEFKFSTTPNWDDGTNLGAGANEGELDLDSGAGNLSVPDWGMYRFTVDLSAEPYTWTYEAVAWGLIGTSVPPYDWSEDVDMTWDADAQAMSITTDLVAGEYKFRANDDWTINYGDNDADGSLEQDGANIVLPEDGNWTIRLILSGPVPTYEAIKN